MFADTQAAQNLKSANKKTSKIHNSSNFSFPLNSEILCIDIKYTSYSYSAPNSSAGHWSVLITQVLLETVAAFVPKPADLTVAVVSVETALLLDSWVGTARKKKQTLL